MKKRRPWRNRTLAFWLSIESVVVTLVTVAPFAMLHILDRFHWLRASTVSVLGILAVMGLVVGITATLFSRQFNRMVSGLTRGLKAVADGDFSQYLEPEEGGPLQPAYEDFNKMSKELQSIQTLRSDFINHFSHEFKTPITAIKGFAELLREPDTTPEEREQYLQIILDESSHLADLANSTLLLTRLESQQFIAEKRPYPLDEQIKRCAILLSPSWEKKQISFTASLEPAEFVGNEELMRHVWINLLDNAVKYTPEGGEITVTLQVRPEELEISVADTGIGMPEEVRSHVFDKYYQGSRSSGSGRGLGLGLSIVYRILELCGGQVRVDTEIYKANGYDIALVQRLLQHSSAAVTQRYIGIEPQRIEAAIQGHAQLL